MYQAKSVMSKGTALRLEQQLVQDMSNQTKNKAPSNTLARQYSGYLVQSTSTQQEYNTQPREVTILEENSCARLNTWVSAQLRKGQQVQEAARRPSLLSQFDSSLRK